jgi:hypothetical protein
MQNQAFILDFNFLEGHELSIEEFLTLLYLHGIGKYTSIYEKCYKSLQERQFIKIDDEKQLHLRGKAIQLIELVTIDSIGSIKNKTKIKKSSRAIQLELDDFIKEFRLLWKGLKPGSMGSEKACSDKMYKWMQDNPSYNKEDILKAAKLYIKSLDNLNYLQQADYFIYKKDAHGESSRLSAFIDEIDNKPVDDWTTKLN